MSSGDEAVLHELAQIRHTVNKLNDSLRKLSEYTAAQGPLMSAQTRALESAACWTRLFGAARQTDEAFAAAAAAAAAMEGVEEVVEDDESS